MWSGISLVYEIPKGLIRSGKKNKKAAGRRILKKWKGKCIFKTSSSSNFDGPKNHLGSRIKYRF